MKGLAIDDAAWSSRWRERAVRDKACLSLGLLLTAAVLPPWPTSPLVAAVALGLLVTRAGTPAGLVARALRGPALFIVIGCISVAVVLTTGDGLGLTVTAESTHRALGVAGHAIAGTSAMLLLAMTTPMVDLLAGLRRLRLPEACVEVAGLIYRMLFILLDSVGTIRESQAARLGYSSLRRSLRSAGMLTAAILTRSWSRARRLEQGLAGRELTASLRTLDDPTPSSPAFLVAGGATLVALVSLAALTTGIAA
ncbi:cobalt ECF transporter T component CbiQ [Aeromicrobium sp. A1-2]|uniref:cobalt ECF transporter T component CbiQ n=1 Tax=Aeromicrobium sp. A1-2 TaxID=2107713 RepID=UPI000E4ACEE5|nr:cobalt ECF transporter T component CbiQ [Aeromicrobium sp. A1-2]AXT83799.1 cobalt ECF transporter T component CbiQ [Aeromicrobium sp. A1-2]